MVTMLLVTPALAKRIRPAQLISGSLLAALPGAFLLAQLDASSGPVPVALAFVLFQAGCAPIVTLANGIVMSAVAPEKAGSAAAISETSAELGFALGIAAFGSLFTFLYRSNIELPSGISSSASAAANDSLAGALEAARTMPAALGEAVTVAARDAFTHGVVALAIAAGALLVGVAVLVYVRLRDLPVLGAEVAHGEPALAA
jgi:DHA2 family multidrug resistance protein-like MFS transporter